MKQLVCSAVILAALFISAQAICQTHNVEAAKSSLILDVIPTANGLAAVGERGHIIINNQNEWHVDIAPVNATLTRIVEQAGKLWAIGHDGVILKQTDDGWLLIRQDIESEQPLFDLLFLSATEAIAIGAYGEFLRSTDGGLSWQEEMHEGLLYLEDREYLAELKHEVSQEDYEFELSTMLPHLNRVIALSDNRLLMVGELGLAAISNDKGQNWQRLELGYEGSMFSALTIAVDGKQRLITAGLRGNLFYSDDGGLNWVRAKNESKATINGLLVGPKGKLIALASHGQFLVSDDSGVSLRPYSLMQGETAVAGAVVNQKVFIGGDQGLRQLSW